MKKKDDEIINLLIAKNIVFEVGLTFDEIARIEEIYGIIFPRRLQNFLMTALPISEGFYNWRNTKKENIAYIKSKMNQPATYINEMPKEIYWCENWGEEPEDEEAFTREVKKRLGVAPKLIPIFSHRYMPVIGNDNPPIISVHGGDVIYMGENLDSYFKVEFGGKDQKKIKFSKINPISFWSDLM